ncbi:MAG TPA: nucleoside hydrolase [Anaerolineaceae bacterium]
MVEKILLDTDIGSDIDDAVCLAYLLSQPECELLGITTVSGEAVQRARIASALCRVAGKEIPIFPGAEQPLLLEQRQPKAQQAAALDKWAHDRDFPMGHAIGFLRDTIRANPGEITLLSIGPLTNLALLFTLDPEIPLLLKRLVMMVGVFSNRFGGVGPLEWNAMIDPHATAVVYHHAPVIHRSIGLDVTRQVVMNIDEVQRRFISPLLLAVWDFAQVWFRHTNRITFHDPLAATTIFDDQICTFERGTIEVELTSQRLLGLTHWKSDPSGRHEVALEVDPERFFNHYFKIAG